MINVSWNDAQQFINWMSRKAGKGYRLPTEAEWEYAARAGSETKYSWGNTIDCSKASYDGGKKSSCYHYPTGKYRGTSKVGSFEANKFGLYDMHGNVWEWVRDWYGEKYYSSSPTNNPQGPSSGSSRVFRGGGWHGNARGLRSASRGYVTPGYRDDNLGFRLLRQP